MKHPFHKRRLIGRDHFLEYQSLDAELVQHRQLTALKQQLASKQTEIRHLNATHKDNTARLIKFETSLEKEQITLEDLEGVIATGNQVKGIVSEEVQQSFDEVEASLSHVINRVRYNIDDLLTEINVVQECLDNHPLVLQQFKLDLAKLEKEITNIKVALMFD